MDLLGSLQSLGFQGRGLATRASLVCVLSDSGYRFPRGRVSFRHVNVIPVQVIHGHEPLELTPQQELSLTSLRPLSAQVSRGIGSMAGREPSEVLGASGAPVHSPPAHGQALSTPGPPDDANR